MTTTEAQATERPWVIDNGWIVSSNKGLIAQVLDGTRLSHTDVLVAEANASLIVQAVNERDALLAERDALRKALVELLDFIDRAADYELTHASEYTAYKYARRALATGETKTGAGE